MTLCAPSWKVLTGSACDLSEIEDHSVHMAMVSTPYWGQRDYGIEPTVWPRAEVGPDGRLVFSNPQDCPGHEWITERIYAEKSAGKRSGEAFSKPGADNAQRVKDARWRVFQTCSCCGCWRGTLGNEPLLEMFIAHLVLIFRETRRVLRPDGSLFLNLGDSYFGSWGNYGDRSGGQRPRNTDHYTRPPWEERRDERPPSTLSQTDLKEKDLIGLPWAVAFALRHDGWWLRSAIVWEKGTDWIGKELEAQEQIRQALDTVRQHAAASFFGLSPYLEKALSQAERAVDDLLMAGAVMPESVKSRCTTSHEYVFHLTPEADSYFDIHALRHDQGSERNPRTVWRVPIENKGTFILPDGRQVAHFAAFPQKLAARAIRAATPEVGVCAKCGAPWRRRVRRRNRDHGQSTPYQKGHFQDDDQARYRRLQARAKAARHAGEPHENPFGKFQTVGWVPTCTCYGEPDRVLVRCGRCGGTGQQRRSAPRKADHFPEEGRRASGARGHMGNVGEKGMERIEEPCPKCSGTGKVPGDHWPPEMLEAWPRAPATVLDMMGGTGTTGLAALAEGRSTIYNDVSPEYSDLARARLEAWPDELPQVPPKRRTRSGDDEADDGPDQLELWEDSQS